MAMKNSNIYWASVPDTELADEMIQRISYYRNHITSNGLYGVWQKKMAAYYGSSFNGNSSQAVTQGGDQGELSLTKVNSFRQNLQTQLTIVTSQRPAGIARAINSDTKSLKASRIGSAISEYYLTTANFEQTFIQGTETAIIVDEGFILQGWNEKAGKPIAADPDTLETVKSGDVQVSYHCPWNAARDIGANTTQQHWYVFSFRANKFDLVSAYPKFKEQILNDSNSPVPDLDMNKIPDGSDYIYVHLLVHDRTAALSDGRYSLLVGKTIVADMKLPYSEFPVDRITSSDVIDGMTGYSASNDMVGLQEISDGLNSVILTNNINFGVQSLVGPEGANLKVSDIVKGARYFEMAPDQVDKLRALQLTKTAPETYQYLSQIDNKMMQMVGSNSIVSGNPEGALKSASGSAMALLQSQAISFNSGLQRAYFKLLSSAMTKLISILRRYADSPRMIQIVGKNKSSALKEFKFSGEDLESISSIQFELVNALAQTQAGRLQMAQDLLQVPGLITSPKQYLTVVQTGQLDVLTDEDEAKNLLILEENEYLSEGKSVQAVITEQHADHIASHMTVIASIDAKSNPDVTRETLAHVQHHIQLWTEASQTNPAILFVTGQQPIPLAQPPQMGPPQGNAPQIQGNGQNPVTMPQEQPNQPNLPTNPLTGEKPTVPGVNAA